ncbi:two-component system sensor histidine kinase KdpD [Actinocorallia herbida]|uniref:histidine kinase n=1 Tax=Actinocorallia herbida TaxID=58109 RepID=A0A3N1DCJ1_9ACTN|nr:DUF4118 domain-containing protein [Actinocorallia herbida]ROO91227.1 two-component system sensor histidine kinase KdpD [Actinocorallia herbida]
MARGQLRIFLGAAPGVGKTYAMLAEGRRRLERGTDVVIGYLEGHDRPRTLAMAEGLEVVPRREVGYRGAVLSEMDVAAVIARAPRVALVDELAHTNVPGAGAAKRWQDVERILEAGIDVVTTVNIQHLESMNDVVAQITGVAQHETVPDEVVRRADQIDLVDMAPEALRRRMAHGEIYAPENVDAALSNYFRVGNLTALRELALLWLAGKVDEQLAGYRAAHGIGGTWEARERVVVALTGGPEGETLIRRAARIAARGKGADLLAVHVTRGDGLAGAGPASLTRLRELAESMGATYHQVVGDDVPRALLDFARAVNATQLVLGVSRRGRFAQLLSPGVGVTTTSLSGPIDVHMVTHEHVGRSRPRAAPAGLAPGRKALGFLLALVGLPLLTWGLSALRGSLGLPSDILFYLAAVVAVALTGGLWPALFAAVGGFGLLTYYFTEPFHAPGIADPDDLIALVVFILVAVGVSTVVHLAARRSREAARLGADAELLSTLAGDVLRGEHAVGLLLHRLRETFSLESATLLERVPEPAPTHRGPTSPTPEPPIRPSPRDAPNPPTTPTPPSTTDGPSTPHAGPPNAQDGSAGAPAEVRPSEPEVGPVSSGGATKASAGSVGGRPSAVEVGLADSGGVTGFDGVSGGGRGWRVVATDGGRPCTEPGEADTEVVVEEGLVLALRGRILPAGDRRILEAFAVQTGAALRRRRLEAEAERARPLEAVDRMRSALLNAVSHDLRTPLASAKAAVESLRSPTVVWTDEERAELADTAAASLDRLDRLVANLLDMSRLQAGALGMMVGPVALEDAVPRALDELGAPPGVVRVGLPADLPEVLADPSLLARILVNLVANALRYSPPDAPVLITAGTIRDRVELRVADRGPGLPAADRERVFLPFQRLDDRGGGDHRGVGLGLALSRGLAEAMGGALIPEDTPGGGLTMIVSLPAISPPPPHDTAVT